MAEKIPESLIDDILESTKKYGDDLKSTKDYSVDEIDDLVASILGEKSSDEHKKEPTLNKSEENSEKTEDEALKSVDEIKFEKPKKQKFSLNLSAIKEIEEIGEETEDTFEEETLKEETVTEEIVEVTEKSDGQLELTENGESLGNQEDKKDQETQTDEPIETDEESDLVAGQISIEKTRLFNEVKIRSEHNPYMEHNLGNKVARTTTAESEPLKSPASPLEEEKYRQHFMNVPKQNIEKTLEHKAIQKTIETPGVVIKGNKSSDQNNEGIQPLPTLVSAEYEYESEKTRVIKTGINKKEIAENQIILDGFLDSQVEERVIQSEKEAEDDLSSRREAVVDSFVKSNIFKQDDNEKDESPNFERQNVSVAREYFGPKDKKAVTKIYLSEKKKLITKIVTLSIICGIMTVLGVFASTENGNFEIYGNNEYIYVGIQLILLIVSSFICFSSFKGAFQSLRKKTIDSNFVVVLSSLVGVIQCCVGFGFTDSVESTASLFTSCAVLPMILQAVGELVRNINDYNNFLVVSYEDRDFYSVQNIEGENVANEISRGLMLGDPDIKYSVKTEFPARFVEISKSTEITGRLFKIAVPMVLLASAIIGIVNGVISKSAFGGISTFSAAVLMGLPAAASLISSANLRASNKRLNRDGGFINGYSAVEDVVNSNGVVIDSGDALMGGGCNIEGIKLYHKMRIDEAILYTASVVIEADGVLAHIFNDVIIGRQRLLYKVENWNYEEKLGCSCWINNQRVLVGNRALLTHHNVDTPDEELEKELKEKGKNVIYLAIEGKIAAMFVVVYKADDETAKYFRKIEKDGITIFMRTTDSNITEEFIEDELGLPSKVVKIISSVAGEMFKKTKAQSLQRTDAKIIHDGKTKTMLSTLHSAFCINSFINTSFIIQLIASFLGVGIVGVFAFLSGIIHIGVWQVIIYQAVWALVLSLLPMLRKN